MEEIKNKLGHVFLIKIEGGVTIWIKKWIQGQSNFRWRFNILHIMKLFPWLKNITCNELTINELI